MHEIEFTCVENLFMNLKNIVSIRNINAINTTEEIFFEIKNELINKFPSIKFVYSPLKANNISNQNEQLDIVMKTHKRAHRNYKNNAKEISENYFWPRIREDCKKYAIKCETCLMEKYERQPKKEILKPTPIPEKSGHSVHMDIFHLNKRLFISSSDRFSKYCHLREIPNKLNISLVVEEILSQVYPECKEIMTDNESVFASHMTQSLFQRKNIKHVKTPVSHSTTNGQVERIHSTFLEIANSVARDNSTETDEEIFNAVQQYNNTIHSVIGFKPNEVFFNKNGNFDIIKERLRLNQERVFKHHNKKRTHKEFKPGDTVFKKSDRRCKNKRS